MVKLVVVFALACLSVSCASSVLGQRNAIESGMQPDVVARTLSAVQGEWRAQVAIFADCDSTAKLPGSSIVNCKDAQGSFSNSCGTITNAMVQGSGGDKDVMHEYMSDVCRQRAMSGWHQQQCNSVAMLIGQTLSVDKYENRMNFHSAKVCDKLWSQLLQERVQEVAKETAEKEAAENKAAADDAEDEKARMEAQKKEEDRKKTEEVQHEKEEASAKAAEAKAKAAEAAAQAAEKKAEAENVAAAAQQKQKEVVAAEQKQKEVAAAEQMQKAATKAADVVAKTTEEKAPETPKAAVVAAVAKKAPVENPVKKEAAAPVEKTDAEKIVDRKERVARKLAERKAAVAKIVAATAAKKTAGFLVTAASPAPAGAGAPGGKPENLNDKMPLKAAEQGFTGKKVQHADGKTAAADWQNEYNSKGASFLAAAAGPAPAAAGAPAGGKPENLNDKMPLKAAEQGFTGKKVQHADGKTAAGDWQKEYATKK